MSDTVVVAVRGEFSDEELNALHAAAFEHGLLRTPWNARLAERSLTWVVVRRDGNLVGFINVIGDGGIHAVALDTCVSPSEQRQGVGSSLVTAAAQEAQRLGCHWLHVDYPSHLAEFYEQACGLRPTKAGLLDLTG